MHINAGMIKIILTALFVVLISSFPASKNATYDAAAGMSVDASSNKTRLAVKTAASAPFVETISISDAFIIEPTDGTAFASFVVRLSNPILQGVSVSVSTSNGTATAPDDFVHVPSTQLTFLPGQIVRTINVTVNSDGAVEPLESFFVNLSDANGATISDSQGVGRIKQGFFDGDIAYGGSFNLTKVNGDGGSPIDMTSGSVPFAWSPDGSKIAYGSSFPRSIFIANADGSSPTNLTPTTQENFGPVSWSPDATRIAFISTRDGNEEIYVMNADGSNQLRLTNNSAFDEDPKWSPDGSKIIFTSSRDGNNEIYISNPDGTAQTNISTSAADDRNPSWSPDGTKIAFSSNRDGPSEIYSMMPDGTQKLRLTNNSSNSFSSPIWSPTGDKIAFRNEGFPSGLFVMNVDGSGPVKVSGNDLSTFARPFTWSPVGTRIAFDASFTQGFDTSPHIFVVNVDGTNRKQLTPSFAVNPVWQPIPPVGLLVSIGDVSIVEGTSGTISAVFNVLLSQTSAQTVTANFNTLDVTATAGDDYVSSNGVVTFSPGQTSRPIAVTVNSDTTLEPDESFLVELTSITNAQFSNRVAVGTIISDDRPANDLFDNAVELNNSTGNVDGTNIGATIEPNEPSSLGSASVWYKWQAPTTGTFTFLFSNSGPFPPPCIVDQIIEVFTGTSLASLTKVGASNMQSNSLTLIAGFEAVAGTTYFVRIDGALRNFKLTWSNGHKVTGAIKNVNGRELAGSISVTTFFCTTSIGYSSPYTVYFPVGHSVTAKISGREESQIFSGSGVQDFTISTPVFNLQAVIRHLPGPTGVTVSKCLFFTGVPCTTSCSFLGQVTSGELRYDCGPVSNTGDYRVTASSSGRVFRPSGESCQDDPGSACLINLGGSVAQFFTGLPTVSVNSLGKTEGNSGTTTFDFTVTLGAPSTEQVTVNVATADDSATVANNDYQPIASTQLTFAPGETTKTVSVSVNGDSTSEENENFFLNLSNAVNGVITSGQGTGTIQNDDLGNTVQFSSSSASASEAANQITVTVNRNITTGAASVDYATSDTAGADKCNEFEGKASSRCDYLITFGTLQFAAGEASKTVTIPIINDVFAEGDETFTITLANATGATVGSNGIATLTITDNEATNGTNPIGTSSFFVRQHYIDFLNREPDQAGFNFWVNEIEDCGANAACREVKRINVSGAFFISIEFQETGYLVYRFYKSGFGNLPGAPVPVSFLNFLKDTQQIGLGVQVNVGEWKAQLEANKQAYALAFVQRAAFQSAFPNSMTADQFVSKLDTNAGGVLSTTEKANLIAMLGATPADTAARALVVRAVAEDDTLEQAEFNKAFVLMQYFGYMRRNPNEAPDADFGGFNFWLGKLNEFNGNFIAAEMVKAFITSIEYRERFGP